jgi:hypothetical protein
MLFVHSLFCRTHYNDTALFRCGSSRICSADLRIRIAGIPSAFPFLIIAYSMLLVHSHGRLELDNNRAERSFKPFVIGRKNQLFANTLRGARANAIYYSIIETAKENGLNLYEYLSDVFRNAPNGIPAGRLLPWLVRFVEL